MKTKIILIAIYTVALCSVHPCSAQDMARTQSLVNQALQLADAARANSDGASARSTTQQGWSNPFSAAPPAASAMARGNAEPGVAVTGSNIRVNAGGIQLDVPRTGGVNYPPMGSRHVTIPPTSTTVANAMQKVQHWRNFADAVNSFRVGKFDNAASMMQQVNPSPNAFPAFNHFHSLCAFADGNYERSAEYAYAGLAQNQPIFGWDQLRGYYGDPGVYARQYQTLQTKAAAGDASVSAQFLLGYHHLMLGHRKQAAQVFEHVLTRLPNDPVVQQTLTFSQQLPPQPR